MRRVVEKVVADRCQMILVVPNWSTCPWFKTLKKYVGAQCYFPSGSKLFELGGKACKGTRWGTWVVMVSTQQGPHAEGMMEWQKYAPPRPKAERKVSVVETTGRSEGKGPVRFTFAPQPPRQVVPPPQIGSNLSLSSKG